MIFTTLYNISLSFFAVLCSPKILYDYFLKKKYRESLKQRLGFDFPIIDKKNKPLIWVHAVSVGETRAVIHLCKLLSKDYTLLISSITETGHAEAKRSLKFADYHVFLPFDFKWIIEPIVNRVKPEFIIISETDLWYQFLSSAKQNGAKTVVVNGKISETSAKRLIFAKFFANSLYGLIDFFCMQSNLYKERFLDLGVPPNKIEVTGNLKFDDDNKRLNENELICWKARLGITPDSKVIAVGSTHDPEETLILDALEGLRKVNSDLKILLVPRHPERFGAIEKSLALRNAPFCRFTKTQNCNTQIVLIDAMGVLRDCYQVADLAIVGGSFTPKVGGHNILEPLGYGTPVLFGPYMHGQPDLLELVLKSDSGVQVADKEIDSAVNSLLNDPKKQLLLKNAGLKLMEEIKGSTKKTFDICEKLFS